MMMIRTKLFVKMTGGFRFYSSGGGGGKKIINGIMLGPPGSGKGTISERICKTFSLQHLSSGDILRSHIQAKSELGKKIENMVSTGALVPIEMLAPLVEDFLKKISTGWLLDGYPRALEQAERLHSNCTPNIAIHLDVPFETIINRIKCRWMHAPSGRVYNLEFNPPKVPGKDDQTGEPLTQRDDDKPESVKNRLNVYQKTITPVLDFYRQKNMLVEFKGTESNVIWPKVKEYLEKF